MMWMDQLTTFYDPNTEEPIQFIDNEGYIYTGILMLLSDLIEKTFQVESVLKQVSPGIDFQDVIKTLPEDFLHGITLRSEYQIPIAAKSICRGRGTIELATGAGKTEISLAILKWLFTQGKVRSAIIVADGMFLMEQFYIRFLSRIPEGITIGRLGGGFRELGNQVTVGVADSFYSGLKRSDPEVCETVRDADLLIVDESHHLRSRSWRAIAQNAENAKFRYGLTPAAFEDPMKVDADDYFIIGLTGPVVSRLPASWLTARGYLAEQVISMLHVTLPQIKGTEWHSIYRNGIVRHDNRNTMICLLAEEMYQANFKIMVLVQHLEHGWRLLSVLNEMGYPAVFARGGRQVDMIEDDQPVTKEMGIEDLKNYLDDMDRFILIGSGGVLDEGADLPFINTLILAAGYKKHRRTLQRLGRGMRPKPGSNRVYTFDFCDRQHKSLERHSAYRVYTYGYEQHYVSEGLDWIREELQLNFDMTKAVPIDKYYKEFEKEHKKKAPKKKTSFKGNYA